jgi:hypothetical protein
LQRNRSFAGVLAAASIVFVGCENAQLLGGGSGSEIGIGGDPPRGAPARGEDPTRVPTLQHELAQARAATEKYKDIAVALADGYVDIDVYVPGMGYHYMKAEHLDDTFEIERPEILVYTQMHHHPGLRLVAVEYAVPLDLSEDAPEGFTGDQDEWHHNDPYGLWTLHAWLWFANPDGVFAELNPRVP